MTEGGVFLSPCPLGCCSSSRSFSRSSEAFTQEDDTNISAFRLPSWWRTAPWAGRCWLESSRGLALSAGTEVVASRDVFRRFFLFIAQSFRWLFPRTNSPILKQRQCLCQRDNLSTRGASRDPPNVNQIQVERRWTDRVNEPNTAGTSGHGALFPPCLGGKRANNICSYSFFVKPNTSVAWSKRVRLSNMSLFSLPNVTLWWFWSMLRTAALNLDAQLSSVFYKLASSS